MWGVRLIISEKDKILSTHIEGLQTTKFLLASYFTQGEV